MAIPKNIEHANVDIYQNGFSVDPISDKAIQAFNMIGSKLVSWKWVKRPPTWRLVKVMDRVYGGRTMDGKRWLPIYAFGEFLSYLNVYGIKREDLTIRTHVPSSGKDIIFPRIKEVNPPYDEQIPIIQHLSDGEPLSVTNLQTGKGKTQCALDAMTILGKPTIIQMKAGYISRWIVDLEELFDFDDGDIVSIRSTPSFKTLMSKGLEGSLTAKVILVSNDIIRPYLKEYETTTEEEFSYPCTPLTFMEDVGIGLRIIDEVHEDFHFQMRSMIYMPCYKTIALSATLDTDDKMRQYIYSIVLPKARWKSIPYDKYIGVIAYMYDSLESDKESFINHDSYSHGEYEKWLMKDQSRLNKYFELVYINLLDYYFKDREDGQRALIFYYLTDMCRLSEQYLKPRLPDILVSTYVSESSTEELKADVINSTVGSAGTAIDIRGLKLTILTRAMDKREANLQVLGRTRRMRGKWSNITPIMLYFVDTSVAKHVSYHENKIRQYDGKVLYHTSKTSGRVI